MESKLFGDAKANARTREVTHKQDIYKQAKSAFETDATDVNQAALAMAAFDIGKFDEAERLYADLAKTHQDDMDLLTNLAFTYKNLNKIEDAKRTFLRVAEINPKHNLARSAENEVWMMDPSYKPSWMRR